MGFFSLFLVSLMPILQVLLIGLLGSYLATGYSGILTAGARKDMNNVVFTVFTPALTFASLAETVTLQDLISWWFMPVNIGIIYTVGCVLAWIANKMLKTPQHLKDIVVAFCSAGNFGNLLLITIPASCDEDGNPFGDDSSTCRSRALSYAAFSMALGGLYIWTHTYSVMKRAGKIHRKIQLMKQAKAHDLDDADYHDAEEVDDEVDVSTTPPQSNSPVDRKDSDLGLPLLTSSMMGDADKSFCGRLKDGARQIAEELLAPPTIAAISGFAVGATPWLKSLIIGTDAPLRVIQDSLKLLGNGTIPCVTLILGGNLTQGKSSRPHVKPSIIVAIIIVRYVISPVIGIFVVKAAHEIGFLPHDRLYRYAMMVQFTLPPAMTIGTLAQLFDAGQEESSVIFLWTYLVAAIAMTLWSTIFMSILLSPAMNTTTPLHAGDGHAWPSVYPKL